MKNVLEWLEQTTLRLPDKYAFLDMERELSFQELLERAQSIGTALAKEAKSSAPIPVFSRRNVYTPSLFWGVTYSGHAYVPVDSRLPKARIQKILTQLSPSIILTDAESRETVKEITGEMAADFPEADADAARGRAIRILTAEELLRTQADPVLLGEIRSRMLETDPLYIIYTSGSTGNPKGVITSHRSLICYIDAYSKVMRIEENDRLGNQSPLDYIAAIRDMYLPLKHGCSTLIIPKEYFMEPNRLFECMNTYQVTSVGWSVSAFTIALSLGAFEEVTLTSLKKVCFSGSVMPGKCLRVWQEHLPDARFVNQYGPTEATASCTYYVVDHVVSEDELIPIGRPYDNYRVFILNDRNEEAAAGEPGEICIGGPCLALGYYGDPERTRAAFMQHPGNDCYREWIYRTGDIGLRREDGLLEFHGRKDRQIKHMGHRVELDEIEYAANQLPQVKESCCVYQKEKEKLHLFYQGDITKRDLLLKLRESLPDFMVPRKVRQMDALPKLPNGKIDMNRIREEL